jgi:hypothetical protein
MRRTRCWVNCWFALDFRFAFYPDGFIWCWLAMLSVAELFSYSKCRILSPTALLLRRKKEQENGQLAQRPAFLECSSGVLPPLDFTEEEARWQSSGSAAVA